MIKLLKTAPLIFVFFSAVHSQEIDNMSRTLESVELPTDLEYFIGGIKDLRFSESGIVIIDETETKVIALSRKGDSMGLIGRSGRGPGEYLDPSDVELAEMSIFLLDKSESKIIKYSYNKETQKYEYLSSKIFEFQLKDMCFSQGSGLFVLGVNSNGFIHSISQENFQIIRSLGKETNEVSPNERLKFSDGKLSCDRNYVYVAPRLDNEILALDINNGKVNFNVKLEEISPIVTVIERLGERSRLVNKYYTGESYNELGDYHDIVFNIDVITDNKVLVQYIRKFKDSDTEDLITLVVDLLNNEYKVLEDVPKLFSGPGSKFASDIFMDENRLIFYELNQE